jgi:hypothetical protein
VDFASTCLAPIAAAMGRISVTFRAWTRYATAIARLTMIAEVASVIILFAFLRLTAANI